MLLNWLVIEWLLNDCWLCNRCLFGLARMLYHNLCEPLRRMRGVVSIDDLVLSLRYCRLYPRLVVAGLLAPFQQLNFALAICEHSFQNLAADRHVGIYCACDRLSI